MDISADYQWVNLWNDNVVRIGRPELCQHCQLHAEQRGAQCGRQQIHHHIRKLHRTIWYDYVRIHGIRIRNGGAGQDSAVRHSHAVQHRKNRNHHYHQVDFRQHHRLCLVQDRERVMDGSRKHERLFWDIHHQRKGGKYRLHHLYTGAQKRQSTHNGQLRSFGDDLCLSLLHNGSKLCDWRLRYA